MKVKKCPIRKHCFDYKDGNCDNCEIGNELKKLNKRIDRLKKQNETLTIQRNAWALTAKALGDKWISVDEMLPDCEQGAESKAVLFITKQGFMYTGYYGCGGIFHDRYFREFKNATEGYDISNVTHWMPLPEPPKMKGGAE